jgi:hypothetical protein
MHTARTDGRPHLRMSSPPTSARDPRTPQTGARVRLLHGSQADHLTVNRAGRLRLRPASHSSPARTSGRRPDSTSPAGKRPTRATSAFNCERDSAPPPSAAGPPPPRLRPAAAAAGRPGEGAGGAVARVRPRVAWGATREPLVLKIYSLVWLTTSLTSSTDGP